MMSPALPFGMTEESTTRAGSAEARDCRASSASFAKEAVRGRPPSACRTRSVYFGSYSMTRMLSGMGFERRSIVTYVRPFVSTLDLGPWQLRPELRAHAGRRLRGDSTLDSRHSTFGESKST